MKEKIIDVQSKVESIGGLFTIVGEFAWLESDIVIKAVFGDFEISI